MPKQNPTVTTLTPDAPEQDGLSGLARLQAQINPESFAKFEATLPSAPAWGADNATKKARNTRIVKARAKGLSWAKIGAAQNPPISPERCRAICRRAEQAAAKA